MNGKEFYTHVWAIFKDLDEEEEDKFLEEAQNVGFKKESWIDISISLSWDLLCNISQDFKKFNFCSYQYWLK